MTENDTCPAGHDKPDVANEDECPHCEGRAFEINRDCACSCHHITVVTEVAKLKATIRAKDADLADMKKALFAKSAECERAWDQARLDFNHAREARSERDALADKLEAVVDAVMVTHPPNDIAGVEKTECRICGVSRNSAAFEHVLPECPLSNLPATVQARRDQFEKMKAKLNLLAWGDWANPDDSEWENEGTDFDHGFNAASHAARRVAKEALKDTSDDK